MVWKEFLDRKTTFPAVLLSNIAEPHAALAGDVELNNHSFWLFLCLSCCAAGKWQCQRSRERNSKNKRTIFCLPKRIGERIKTDSDGWNPSPVSDVCPGFSEKKSDSVLRIEAEIGAQPSAAAVVYAASCRVRCRYTSGWINRSRNKGLKWLQRPILMGFICRICKPTADPHTLVSAARLRGNVCIYTSTDEYLAIILSFVHLQL